MFYVAPLTFEFEEIKDQEGSETFHLGLYMPYPEEDLRKDLRRRVSHKRGFTNQEITFLFYDVLNGLYHMQILGICHGKLNPSFIARTLHGYAVLEDPMHDLFTVIDLQKMKRDTKDGDRPGRLYLSPEAYRCAKMGMKAGSGYNLIKSDVFSFGLILLEAGTQMDLSDVYNGDGTFNQDALEYYIHMFKCRYPENNLITSSVAKMLEVKEIHRPDFKELFEKAPTYEMVKKYFEENPELEEKDVISMRTSMHGSANVMIDPKDFAKLSPAPSKYQNYSESKQSRYIQSGAKDSMVCENKGDISAV
jgi:serine/threonine protein kinase